MQGSPEGVARRIYSDDLNVLGQVASEKGQRPKRENWQGKRRDTAARHAQLTALLLLTPTRDIVVPRVTILRCDSSVN